VEWLWREDSQGCDDLDSWACQQLTSFRLESHMIACRGVPCLSSMDDPSKKKRLRLQQTKDERQFTRAELEPFCDQVIDHLPFSNSKALELKRLVSMGILVEEEKHGFRFASPLVGSTYIRERYSTAKRDALPTELEGSKPEMRDVVRLLVRSMDPKQLGFGLSLGTDGKPLEYLYENEMYRGALRMIPSQYGVQCQVGKTFRSRGMVDLFINDKFRFAIELLREGDRMKEHRDRFQPRGQYGFLVQKGIFKQWAVIDFRDAKGPVHLKETDRLESFDNVYRVYYCAHDFKDDTGKVCPQFSVMRLVYPDLTHVDVTLVGK